jgi:hypothetical protein
MTPAKVLSLLQPDPEADPQYSLSPLALFIPSELLAGTISISISLSLSLSLSLSRCPTDRQTNRPRLTDARAGGRTFADIGTHDSYGEMIRAWFTWMLAQARRGGGLLFVQFRVHKERELGYYVLLYERTVHSPPLALVAAPVIDADDAAMSDAGLIDAAKEELAEYTDNMTCAAWTSKRLMGVVGLPGALELIHSSVVS